MPKKIRSLPLQPPIPTDAEYLHTMLAGLKSRLETETRHLAHFKKKFDEDPLHALEYGDYVFEAAAIVYVYGRVLEAGCAEDSKMTLESLRTHALREALNRADSPKRSTSSTSKIAHEEITAAWVRVFKMASRQYL